MQTRNGKLRVLNLDQAFPLFDQKAEPCIAIVDNSVVLYLLLNALVI